MFERVKSILKEYAVVDEIKEDSMLEADLGLSSFEIVSIVMEFEEEFHIEIPDRDIGKFLCVRDILRYLQEHGSCAARGPERRSPGHTHIPPAARCRCKPHRYFHGVVAPAACPPISGDSFIVSNAPSPDMEVLRFWQKGQCRLHPKLPCGQDLTSAN